MLLGTQASLALSHLEQQHQQAVAKLKQEFGTAEQERQAEALNDWSQLDAEKKARMRTEAQRLMAQLQARQTKHDHTIAAMRRAEKALRMKDSKASMTKADLLNEDIRLKDDQHAKELEQLDAKARTSSAMRLCVHSFALRVCVSFLLLAPGHPRLTAIPAGGSVACCHRARVLDPGKEAGATCATSEIHAADSHAGVGSTGRELASKACGVDAAD